MSPNPDDGAGPEARQSTEPRSFEAAYRELQDVVEQLETGGPSGLDLEQAVRLFERGTELLKTCDRIVDTAELRVTRLVAETATPVPDAAGDA